MAQQRLAVLAGLAVAVTTAAAQQADTAVRVSFGGFVDAYYAWDFGRPPTFDRSFASGVPFTTQPSRHNEFNVNLAFIEARLEGARTRGRVALQTGTSVQSNYAGEPTNGSVSGPGLSRVIQEAFAGVKVGSNAWIDAGVFFSHMGMESWISRENPTYTRSLVADYSPYYSSGVRATWQRSPRLALHLHVVNGWQNIAENNSGKGVGMRVDFSPTPQASFSYYNFLSDEAGNLLRTFNGVGAKYSNGRLTLLGQGDYGTQAGSAGAPSSNWYGLLAVARWQVRPAIALVARGERFDDEDGVVVATGVAGAPLRANGASVGVDVAAAPRAVWRTELRGWSNRRAVFPDASSAPQPRSLVVVSSLGLTM